MASSVGCAGDRQSVDNLPHHQEADASSLINNGLVYSHELGDYRGKKKLLLQRAKPMYVLVIGFT